MIFILHSLQNTFFQLTENISYSKSEIKYRFRVTNDVFISAFKKRKLLKIKSQKSRVDRKSVYFRETTAEHYSAKVINTDKGSQ